MSAGGTLAVAAAACLGLGLGVTGVPALAYMGGPIRAHVVGVEPETERVFYYLTFHDERGYAPKVWFFDLKGEHPEQARHDPSLENPDDGFVREEGPASEAWASLAARLTPLSALSHFDLRVTLRMDSIGVEPEWHSPTYAGHLAIEGQGVSQECSLTIYCEPMIVIHALYQIPGRIEAIAVVSYIGRSYGCEEVERPVLLTASQANGRAPLTEGAGQRREPYRTEPFVFGKNPVRGCCAGQFVGYLAEVGSPKAPIFWHLAWHRVMMSESKVWMVSLNTDNPRQPIRYDSIAWEAPDGGYQQWRPLLDLKGRHGEIYAKEPVDLTLHLDADSVGVDSACGVPRYQCEIAASTPAGSGTASLTMFCNCLVKVRGVFPLPGRCELLILTYTSDPCGCKESDVPLVIFPR